MKKAMKKSELTIILTTKGRDAFTLRFITYIGINKIPFDVIIGDGAPQKKTMLSLKKILKKYPTIQCDYYTYNDFSVTKFYEKLKDLSKKVKTKYAVIMDNDDFILPTGAQRQIDFLNRNPKFVSSGGIVSGFEISKTQNNNRLFGQVVDFRRYYAHTYAETSEHYKDRTLAVLNVAEKRLVNYYKIFRTSVLSKILSELNQLKFKSLLLFEYYFSMRAESLGKNHFDKSSIYLLRQIGTSVSSAGNRTALEIVKNVLGTNYFSESSKMIKYLVKKIKIKHKKEFMKSFADKLAKSWLSYLTPIIIHDVRLKSSFLNNLFILFIKTAKGTKNLFKHVMRLINQKSKIFLHLYIFRTCFSFSIKNYNYNRKVASEILKLSYFLNNPKLTKENK